MKRTSGIFILFFLVLQSGPAWSQDYETGLGLRGGVAWGFTVKHFVTTDGAAEGILTARYNGFNATALYEKHLPVFDTEGFYFYYGGGAHIGMWNTTDKTLFRSTKLFAGVDGIIGLEYTFDEVPVSLGMDWKPGFNLISEFGFFYDELALSVRFLIR